MVLVASKTDTSASSSPLSIAPQKEGESSKGTLSFSELLRGVTSEKEDKTVQNGALILSLGDVKEEVVTQKSAKTDKSESLLSLLKGQETSETTLEKLPLELNPKITEKMTPSELKELINEAKQYLKDKITSMEGFKKSEIASLPKTLKGLAQVAQKFGIELSKITLEEVKSSVQTAKPTSVDLDNKVLKTETLDKNQKVEIKTKQENISNEDKHILAAQTKDTSKKTTTTTTTLGTQTAKQTEVIKDNQQRTSEQVKIDTKTKESTLVAKETPLFKAQTKTEISTEEIVNARTNAIEAKTPKEKANDTLQLLLRGEKAATKENGVNLNLSVATARVISPTVTTATVEPTKNLESLLRGETQESNSTQGKLDGLNITKSDSLEVKINEAKQMVKYLSQDVKTAIEDYKSPFTRVKVQLNPQKLGEVDLTVVQRGKNLHISLSSNNSAINTLAMNANDLKMQLSNNGINNATLNFSNNSQSQDGSASQQQNNHQQRQEAGKEYNYFEGEETNEEILSSLEIVVPSYA